MISRELKDLFFKAMNYPMLINGYFYKYFLCPSQGLKVHLGNGQEKYLDSWINVDANFITAKVDVWANLLNPLPFRDQSVDLYVIEHLPDRHLQSHFNQMYKALRKNGGIRIGAPHVGNACRKYVEQDIKWFSDFPDSPESIGGRLMNFIYCRGEHLTALDETYLEEIASNAGFTDIKFMIPGKETCLSDLGIDENVLLGEFETDFDCPHTVVLEARKI